MVKQLNIVLFGPPGAGKGTQSENLINKYGLVHLSTGDILRSEINRGTDLGKKAKEVMDRGDLVSDAIVIDMIEVKIDENPHAKGFIFDGFPRTEAQAIALDDLLQKKGSGIGAMLALEVDNEELVKRLLIRGQDSGREDDKDETVIRNRIQEYTNKTLPLKNYYSEQGKFHSINGIGTKEEIFKFLVDRIIFLHAEMDLTALETDIEHLDLTINDFEVANDIAPELLLEIDAIKRAEAEEEEEEREKKANEKAREKALKQKATKVEVKATPVAKSKAKIKTPAKKVSKPAVTKAKSKSKPKAKPVAKKVITKKKVAKPTKKLVKKAVTKKTVKKAIAKKMVKKAVAKKPVVKKVIKKGSASTKALKKVAVKKSIAKKVVKKIVKKAVKKVIAKKTIKKVAPKKVVKKTTKPTKKVIAKKKKR
jgi:adenylate kinase